MHLRRMAGLTGRTAAADTDVECRLWSVLEGLPVSQNDDAARAPMTALSPSRKFLYTRAFLASADMIDVCDNYPAGRIPAFPQCILIRLLMVCALAAVPAKLVFGVVG